MSRSHSPRRRNGNDNDDEFVAPKAEDVLAYISPQYYWFPILLFVVSVPIFDTYSYSIGGVMTLYISLMMYYNFIQLPEFFGEGYKKFLYCLGTIILYILFGFIWARFGRWYLFIYSEQMRMEILKVNSIEQGIKFVQSFKSELFTHAIFWPMSIALSLCNDVIAQLWNMIIEYSERHMAQDLLNRATRLKQ